MRLRRLIFKKFLQLIIHALFWSGVLLFYTYFFSYDSGDVGYIISFSLFLMPITIATTYVSIYKLIPDYLIKKKYWQFGLYSGYTLIVSSYLIVVSVFFGLVYLSDFQSENMAPISRSILFVAVAVYMIVVLVSAFKLLKINLSIAKQTRALETKILNAELQLKKQQLKYLKMQIHPHFLFNTLNTLYGFALKNSEQTPELILKLSNLLDYILYQTNKPSVLLIDEIRHLQDYISLEQIRFNDTLNLDFDMDLVNRTAQVPPMLLMPFVENSFKHGRLIDGKLKIKLKLSTNGNNIHFQITNSKNELETDSDGIGLENIKSRLKLLYNKSYELQIENLESSFKVNLKLPLRVAK